MEKLFETDHGISSKNENDIEDKVSWYESEPELDAFSYTNNKTDASKTEPEDEDAFVSQEVRGRDRYLWKMEPKSARRTPRRTIVTSAPGSKGKEREADTLLESFELFFDDYILSESVTWTNQKIENVREAYTHRPGFTYDTNETEIRALIGVLLVLVVTKTSKEITPSVWEADGTGKPICFATMSQKLFFFYIVYRLMILPQETSEEPLTN